MPEEVKELIEGYQGGKITRRHFIQRVVAITGSLAVATDLMESLLPSGAYAAQVDPNDPALVSRDVQYTGKAGTVFAYLSRPKASGTYPGLIVIHENRGLNDHILDVARRFAKKGYVALAPAFLSRHGGTKKVNPEDKGLRNMRKLAPVKDVIEDAEAGFTYLRGLSAAQGDRMGVTGFCWGGESAFAVAN